MLKDILKKLISNEKEMNYFQERRRREGHALRFFKNHFLTKKNYFQERRRREGLFKSFF